MPWPQLGPRRARAGSGPPCRSHGASIEGRRCQAWAHLPGASLRSARGLESFLSLRLHVPCGNRREKKAAVRRLSRGLSGIPGALPGIHSHGRPVAWGWMPRGLRCGRAGTASPISTASTWMTGACDEVLRRTDPRTIHVFSSSLDHEHLAGQSAGASCSSNSRHFLFLLLLRAMFACQERSCRCLRSAGVQ